jgi:hypothetical protein
MGNALSNMKVRLLVWGRCSQGGRPRGSSCKSLHIFIWCKMTCPAFPCLLIFDWIAYALPCLDFPSLLFSCFVLYLKAKAREDREEKSREDSVSQRFFFLSCLGRCCFALPLTDPFLTPNHLTLILTLTLTRTQGIERSLDGVTEGDFIHGGSSPSLGDLALFDVVTSPFPG